MLVRAKERCFQGGSRHKEGAIFEFYGPLPKCLEPVNPPEPEKPAEIPAEEEEPMDKSCGKGKKPMPKPRRPKK